MNIPMTLTNATIGITILVIFSVLGLVVVRRIFRSADLIVHHPVTDPLLQVVGMMFAILIGFMCGDAMNRFATARAVVQQEACSVADVFRLAEGFHAEERDKIRALCMNYCDDVINDEWPKLAQRKSSAKVWKTYNELWHQLTRLKVQDESEACVLQSILPCMVNVGDNRRMRIESMHNGLPLALWIVLGVAGLATVLFTFFFSAENGKLQMSMTAIIALVIGLNVFLLASYDDPFTGDVMIGPDAFVIDKRTFEEALKSGEWEDVR